MGLNQMVWILFFHTTTNILLPSSTKADLTGFFFSFSGIYDWKKKHQINFILSTNKGKKQSCFGFIEALSRYDFFSGQIP